MKDTGKDHSFDSDKAVEELLGKATPRPVPPEAEARLIRKAVNDEWQKVVRVKRSSRRMMTFAMAASVLLAVFLSLNYLRTSGVEDMQVATICKSFGSFYVYGANSQQLAGNQITSVVAGETLRTGNESGLCLEWGVDASLRIDENTTIQFVSADSIYLRSGRIYFDSTPVLSATNSGLESKSPLKIETNHGVVTHVGTQYMTFTDSNRLVVSVRDGQVDVESSGAVRSALSGQQLTVSGGSRPSLANFKVWGDAWHWVEQTSPVVMLEKHHVNVFLDWVGQETGLTIDYESDRVEQYAKEEVLNGPVNTAPREALELWVSGVDLNWNIDEDNGVIYVSERK